MFELLQSMSYWQWLALGLVLLSLEILGTAGYFMWFGISALSVGLILLLIPINWQLQWITFAVIALFTSWFWWRKQSKADHDSDELRTLNQKNKQLIGQTTRVQNDIQAGLFRLSIGDSSWSAKCDQDLVAGTRVKIVNIDGIILTVEPVESND